MADNCVEATLRDHRAELGDVHLLDADIWEWVDRITGPEREQLESARRELAFAEFTLASGLYRQAFGGLRLFLELSFAAVHFSANELERRRWMSDRMDFSWSKALDEETGVLSAQFVTEFEPAGAADARRYSSQAARCYRYCSQFVHGKAKASAALPETIEYSQGAVGDWCEWAKKAGESVLYLLYIRYGRDLAVASDPGLTEIMMHRFGHLSSVRDVLEMAGD